jgi:hypothetical protein
MQGHFKHLCFKTFLMVSWGPIWCLFVFPTKVLNICNSCTNATCQVGVHLGIIRLQPLHFPPFVRVCFTSKHTFTLMDPWTSHLIMNLMLGLQQQGVLHLKDKRKVMSNYTFSSSKLTIIFMFESIML